MTDQPLTFSSSSRLVSTWLDLLPNLPEQALVPMVNSGATPAVLVDLGPANGITLLAPSAGSDSGWTSTPLGLASRGALPAHNSGAGSSCAAISALGNQWVFAVTATSGGAPTIQSIMSSGSAPFPTTWTTLPTLGLPSTAVNVAIRAGMLGTTPAIGAWIDTGQTSCVYTMAIGGSQWTQLSPWTTSAWDFGVSLAQPGIVAVEISPQLVNCALVFYGSVLTTPTRSVITSPCLATMLAVGPGSSAGSLVAYYQPGVFNVLPPSLSTVDLSSASPSARLALQGTYLSRLWLGPAGINPTDLYVVDSNRRVLVLHGTASGFSNPAWIGLTADDGCVACWGNEEVDLILATRSKLVRAFRNPEVPAVAVAPTSTGLWQSERLRIDGAVPMLVSRYITRVAFTQPDGSPAAGVSLYIHCGEDLDAEVQGNYTLLGSIGVVAETDGGGMLNVVSTAACIATPELLFSINHGTQLGSVTRNNTEVTALAAITPTALSQILPRASSATVTALQQAVSQAASYALTENTVLLDGRRRRQGGNLMGTWSLTWNGTTATFSTQPTEEQLARLACAPIDLSWGWLGDTWEAVSEGVESTFSIAVQTIGDALTYAIDAVIAGVTYTYSGTQYFVDQALAFAEGILLGVGATFDDIAGLLQFDPSQIASWIWSGKAEAEQLVGSVVTWLQTNISTVASQLPSYAPLQLDQFQVNVAYAIDHFGPLSFRQLSTQPNFPTSTLSFLQAHSAEIGAIAELFTEAAASFSLPGGWVNHPLVLAMRPRFESIIAAAQQALGDASFSQALASFCQSAVSGFGARSAFTTPLPTMLGWILSFAPNLLGLIRPLLPALLALAQEALALARIALGMPISSLFITAVYNWLNPGRAETPTLLNLVGLVISIPANIYTLLTSGEPWLLGGQLVVEGGAFRWDHPEGLTNRSTVIALSIALGAIQLLWLPVNLAANIASVWKAIPIKNLLFFLALLPTIIVGLQIGVYAATFTDVPLTLQISYAVELVLAFLPILLWVALGLLSWVFIPASTVIGTIGSVLLAGVGVVQLLAGFGSIVGEIVYEQATAWKFFGHLATPVDDMLQTIGIEVPAGGAMVDATADLANLAVFASGIWEAFNADASKEPALAGG